VACWIALRKDDSTPPTSDPSQQLPGLESGWASAVLTNDPKEIGRYFHQDFIFVNPRGVLQSRSEHLDDFATGKLKVTGLTVQPRVTSATESGAAVSVEASVTGIYDGRDISGNYRFLDVWLFQGKQWLALARQQTAVAAQ
jgi:hypothetical protein